MNPKLPVDAFTYYMALGPDRSYSAVAEHFKVSKRTVTSTAARERWQERAADIEAKARAKTDEQIVDTVGEMNTRHLKVYRFVQSKALETLKSTPIDNAADAVRAIEMSLKGERLIRGEPSERAELSIEEITKREIRELLEVVDVDDEDDAHQQDQAV